MYHNIDPSAAICLFVAVLVYLFLSATKQKVKKELKNDDPNDVEGLARATGMTDTDKKN